MPDYVYLLENRLSSAQQNALTQVRNAARDQGSPTIVTAMMTAAIIQATDIQMPPTINHKTFNKNCSSDMVIRSSDNKHLKPIK